MAHPSHRCWAVCTSAPGGSLQALSVQKHVDICCWAPQRAPLCRNIVLEFILLDDVISGKRSLESESEEIISVKIFFRENCLFL